MKRLFAFALGLGLFLPLQYHVLQAQENSISTAATATVRRSIDDQRRETIQYGTETEIAALIQTLRTENVSAFDEELIEIAINTRNRNILSGIFGFFGENEKTGLEERAVRAIHERDDEANETVLAAVDYLGRLEAGVAVDYLEELIRSGENRFLSQAIRSLGRASKGLEDSSRVDRVVSFLIDFYDNRNPSDDNRREIVTALGETGSPGAVSFLADIITNDDDRAFLRMAALEAMSKIEDPEGLNAIVSAVSSSDPNIRSTAVAALGPFSGEGVENAILDAFRDSFWRTRIGAAQAAGQRQMLSAIPYLRYRAERDDVPQVRDEAIKALGAINTEETMEILDSLFSERRNSDRVRLMAADMLLQYNADAYAAKIILEMDDAKIRNQTALYNGFIRIFGPVKSPLLEDFAGRLIATGGVIERSLALDLIMNNEFHALAEDVRSLLDERRTGASIARKAQLTLERLGLNADD